MARLYYSDSILAVGASAPYVLPPCTLDTQWVEPKASGGTRMIPQRTSLHFRCIIGSMNAALNEQQAE